MLIATAPIERIIVGAFADSASCWYTGRCCICWEISLVRDIDVMGCLRPFSACENCIFAERHRREIELRNTQLKNNQKYNHERIIPAIIHQLHDVVGVCSKFLRAIYFDPPCTFCAPNHSASHIVLSSYELEPDLGDSQYICIGCIVKVYQYVDTLLIKAWFMAELIAFVHMDLRQLFMSKIISVMCG